MNCKIFKLVNGDEVITECKEDEEDKSMTIFINPAKLVTVPTGDGGVGMALMPWCLYSNQEEYSIDNTHIISTPVDAPNELYNEYNDKFGPGIDDPTKQNIIY